jgi:outer membrane murein-binding lipoprotein Lpp
MTDMKNEEPSKAQGDQPSTEAIISEMLTGGLNTITEATRNAAGQDQAITELEGDTHQLNADVEAVGEEIDAAERNAAEEAAKEPGPKPGSETE